MSGSGPRFRNLAIQIKPPSPAISVTNEGGDSPKDSPTSAPSSATGSTAKLSRRTRDLLLIYSKRPSRSLARAPNDLRPGRRVRCCPVCWKEDCNLRTHREYARQPPGAGWRDASRGRQERLVLPRSVGNDRIDPFVALPVEDASREMLQSFRDFYTTQASSLTDTGNGRRTFDRGYYHLLIRQVTKDPALCYTCMAMGSTYSVVHSQDRAVADTKLLSIYGHTFKALRHQIAVEKVPSDTTIMAAVNLLMCHGIGLGDEAAVSTHPTALVNLVRAGGGVSRLNAQLVSLILWLDFYVTLYTGQLPVFFHEVGITPIFPLDTAPPIKYGQAFVDLHGQGIISDRLLEICETTCRLTELLEDQVQGTGTPARWQYFEYRRNTIAMRNGLVHSTVVGSGTLAECVSIVNNLLLFLVLRLMPWKMPLIKLGDQLQTAVCVSMREGYWDSQRCLLSWALFILLSVEEWRYRKWALQLLLENLTRVYKCKKTNWPTNWREMQRQNLMDHAFSEVYLSTAFKMTCRELGDVFRSSGPQVVKQEGIE